MDAFKVLLLLCVASFCNCRDIPNVGIFGGQNITIDKAPYMAQVRVKGEVVCGGSIINSRFILTAIECVPSNEEFSAIDILVGTELENKAEQGDLYKVTDIFDHPDFSSESKEFNACLIKLETPIKFSNKARPIAIANIHSAELALGSQVDVAGWGMIKRGDKTILNSEQLTQVSLNTISQKDCQRAYDEEGINIKITPNMICAAGEGKGACYGDGGAPLITAVRGYNIQYGLVFYSHRDCGNKPTIFTKISTIRSWIVDVIHKQ